MAAVQAFSALVFSALLLALFAAPFAVSAQDTTSRGRKYKAPPPTSKVVVTVLRDTNGKPVDNAAVIFHPQVDGHDSGNMELKTDDEGKASLDLLVIGSTVRLQIIADGFQTYGQDYKIDKDAMTIDVRLKRPTAQYSAYKKNDAPAEDPDKSTKPADPAAPSTPANPPPAQK